MQYVSILLRAFRKVQSNARAESYFPEKERKPYIQRFAENWAYLFRYRSVNDFYLLYGFDTKGADTGSYIDYNQFARSRSRKNRVGNANSQVVLLRDKFLFYGFMKSNNLAVPEVIAIVFQNKLYDPQWNLLDTSFLDDRNDFFLKDAGGECASFVKRCHGREDFERHFRELDRSTLYVLQETICQHSAMNELNPHSVNTVRIVTVMKDGVPSVLTSVLRVGTNSSGNVDNWAAGGISVGCLEDGRLKEYGFYKPMYGTKTTVHPDTGIAFSDFRIPMYDQVVDLVLRAHRHLYHMHSIGWDIAITDQGPVIIEGNDNWEISLMQACDRPLKKEWEEVVS